MDRLTELGYDGHWKIKRFTEMRPAHWQACNRLADYENIGHKEEFRALKEAEQKRRDGCKYCNDASFHQYGDYIDGQGEVVGVNNRCINCGRDQRRREP